VKHFPHEIYELEPLFQIYLSIPRDSEWETRYIVLLWLSLIVMNPFDLSIIDSSLYGILIEFFLINFN
jgi:hypothetical protein